MQSKRTEPRDTGASRAQGWYWVRIGDKPLEPAHYHASGIWSRIRSIMNYYDADFSEIQERVK